MKLTILQPNFAKALGHVSRIVSNRTTLPVLGNVLLSTKKGKILFSSTDLEIGITTQTMGKIEEEGALTVPARLLSDFINNNSDGTIDVKTEETKMELKSDHYQAHIAGINAEEFPTVPEPPKQAFCSIKKDVLIDAIKKVIIAPANDETRPTLAGIYFHFKGKTLTMAATDSYRLAEKKLELAEAVEEKKMIVPTRTMSEVLRLISAPEGGEEVVIATTENQVFFTVGDTSLVSRLIEGAFVNYQQIVPAAFKITAKVDYRELLAAIKMAALFAKDAANNIRVATTDKEIVVSSALAETGDSTSKVAAVVSGGEMQIAFNARYVMEMLQNVSATEITLKMNDSHSAGVLESNKDKNYLYIVMPLNN